MTKTDKVEFISTVKSVYDRSNLTAKILLAKDLREQKSYLSEYIFCTLSR